MSLNNHSMILIIRLHPRGKGGPQDFCAVPFKFVRPRQSDVFEVFSGWKCWFLGGFTPNIWVQDRAWDPIIQDLGEQIVAFWDIAFNLLHLACFATVCTEISSGNALRMRLHPENPKNAFQAVLTLRKTQSSPTEAPSPPTEAPSDRFEQSVPLFTIEWAQIGHLRSKISLRYPCANIVTALCAQLFSSLTLKAFEMC